MEGRPLKRPLDALIGSKWLFIGGAGYIGSHVLREFKLAGAECFVLDNLATGIQGRLPSEVSIKQADASISSNIVDVCNEYDITGIVHLAAYMQARESVRNPIKFWENNLGATLGVANSLAMTKVQHVIFSSSCSIYGDVQAATTDSPLRPISPYAFTKVASEQVLTQACSDINVRLTILRYFNVIGCGDFSSSFDHSVETLLPSNARNILAGESPVIFGGNLPTPDGSAIRDYLDVRDLAAAHRVVASSKNLQRRQVFNVSSGIPVSVRTILDKLLIASGSTLKPEIVPAKEGDPAEVWATPSSELLELGWNSEYSTDASIRDFWSAFVADKG